MYHQRSAQVQSLKERPDLKGRVPLGDYSIHVRIRARKVGSLDEKSALIYRHERRCQGCQILGFGSLDRIDGSLEIASK